MTTKTLTLNSITLNHAGQSKGGKDVFKATLNTPDGKVYVQFYADSDGESTPQPAKAATPVKPTRKVRKDLSQPATPPAPADEAPPAWFMSWLATQAK